MPLHRSLFFWCGFVVFAFLTWSWAYSMKWVMVVVLSLAGPKDQIQVVVSRGSINLLYGQVKLASETVSIKREPMSKWSDGKGSVWGEGVHWGAVSAFGFRYASVPHWVLVACLVPPWLGLSVWRARRIGRGRKVVVE